MPKEIAAVIQEGLATRQGRQDIPFSFFKQLVLPAQGNNHYPVFFIKAKNADLGYAPSASGTGDMEANLVAFFQFFQPAADGTMAPKMGGKSQVALTIPGAEYSAEKEDWYSFGLGHARRQVHAGHGPQHARHEEAQRRLRRRHPERPRNLRGRPWRRPIRSS